mmetsp:Transcript_8658/g.15871  ORF Transcript_8658/g.15871 Transcript_8658/m.15871 type:complete len:163 (-) Transcript_8658:593-1081(-)|eukprot:CAMPEP_0184508990 /NCGR_PEP_ID=MMETSP0198_2-20121128/1048_1 /TAXON_ID=1112570 /ORGANISM="Thraustochytrium sp., Strain LLF1b" /LENGTH=162 /DNA_ID=CAMNT_0026898797 /DNA_START=439 /DNA_END=927 /DNA_ORIENTATION=-
MRVLSVVMAAAPLMMYATEGAMCAEEYEKSLETLDAAEKHLLEAKLEVKTALYEKKRWEKAVKTGSVCWDDGTNSECEGVAATGDCTKLITTIAQKEADLAEMQALVKDNKDMYMDACKSMANKEEKRLCSEYENHVEKFIPGTEDYLVFAHEKLDACLGDN